MEQNYLEIMRNRKDDEFMRRYKELYKEVDSISNLELKTEVKRMLEIGVKFGFMNKPAASGWHHCYEGGLLIHTLEVTKYARRFAESRECDIDLCVAGALVHDIGKVFDYVTIEESTIGSDVQFIESDINSNTQHLEWGYNECRIPELADIIATHHGKKEWSSLKEIETTEQLVVHLADMASANEWIMRGEL